MSEPSPAWYAVRDQQEKKNFYQFDKRTRGCLGTVVKHLKTADYTVLGLEDILMIERKATASEWHGCLFNDRDRFCRELDRMKAASMAYVLLDFPLGDVMDYPRIASVPHGIRKRIQITGSMLLKTHAELEMSFPWVRFQFTSGRGREYTACLMKRAVEYAASVGRVPTRELPPGE